VKVTVSDTGCGIAPEHLSRIFDPFYTTKPVGEGTGLGLSISFGIVERHGGTISISTVLGTGTAFTVRFR
jgi:signal transduction histidine kinase